MSQSFLWPSTVFDVEDAPRFWTCARTIPRWEKKFAQWLKGRKIPHYLPVYERTTVSHRKRRTTEMPLFPGYVFVLGDHSKSDFQLSGCVARVLKPACVAESVSLDKQITDIWRSLDSGLPILPVADFVPGEDVEVVDGPLQGTCGRFLRSGSNGTLILSVSMLGVGVSVELGPDCRVESVETPVSAGG